MAQYEYGNRVLDGKTVEINEVPRSLRKTPEWACTCPVCGDPFVAAMGKRIDPYFRHKNKRLDYVCDIQHVNQTGLHKRAKEVIQEAQRFHLPAYTIDRDEIDLGNLPAYIVKALPEQYVYRRARWIRCHKVELEKRISDIVPDVVAYTPEGEYLIEICVTNPVSDEKIAKAEKIGLPLLEVDLSDLKGEPISEEDLRKAVIDSCDRTEWRYYPDREKALEAAREFYLNHNKVTEYKRQQELRRKQLEAEKAAKKEAPPKPKAPPEPPKKPEPLFPDPGDLSKEEFEQLTNKMYADGLDDVRDKDFRGEVQVRDRYDLRWLRCCACNEIRRDNEMVMYQYGYGLCRDCHYEKNVPPGWDPIRKAAGLWRPPTLIRSVNNK